MWEGGREGRVFVCVVWGGVQDVLLAYGMCSALTGSGLGCKRPMNKRVRLAGLPPCLSASCPFSSTADREATPVHQVKATRGLCG